MDALAALADLAAVPSVARLDALAAARDDEAEGVRTTQVTKRTSESKKNGLIAIRRCTICVCEPKRHRNIDQAKYLLRIGILHISYIRGLFHEKYFSEKSVLSPELKDEKLVLGDDELGRLINWVDKGVYDAIQNKVIKTFLFRICEDEDGRMIEEYAFSFSYPNSNPKDIAMSISRTGSEEVSTAFKANASALTPNQMRRYGCKLIRSLISLMKTAESKLEMKERTVVVKLLYHDVVTPEVYEPLCAENEVINICNKNPLKMEVGNASTKDKDLVLALKVKGVLDTCDVKNTKSGWNEMGLDNDFDIDGHFCNTQLCRRTFGYVLCTSQRKFKFILDSGATHHMCNDEAIMRNLREVNQEDRLTVFSSDGKEISAERMGSIDLKNFSLNPVGLIPSMNFNVVSVGQLANQGLMICCGNGQFSIYDVTKAQIVGEGYLDSKENEYVFRTLKWSPEVEKLVEIPKNDTDEENVEQQASEVWIIDTGCARHLVPDVSLLTNPKHDRQPFQSAQGRIWSSHRGKVKAGKLMLNDVLCCEGVSDNLISGPMLDKEGYRMTFLGKTCTLVHKDGLELRGVAIQDVKNNTYCLTPQEEQEEGKVSRVSAQGDTKEAKRRRFE